ncbi:MAG: 3-phosphoshikimate 1-carboxyvinyltransferase [Lachnospiraceae bacterium]|nr:3-phosphoshikimate 1-carboxyvinyltransferase [Lachnospiraceae bacterium]
MSQYKVRPVYNILKKYKDDPEFPLSIDIAVPGSKSITNRALLTAALAEGESNLYGLAKGDDVDAFISCLKDLGFSLELDDKKNNVKVKGCGGSIPLKKASINVNSAGTAARFLTTILALSDGEYHIDASEQMKKRPMGDLINALKPLGATFTFEEKENSLPYTVKGAGKVTAKEALVDITKSSQFLSGLILAAPLLPEGFKVKMAGKHSLSYVDMSVELMKSFGLEPKYESDCVTINAGNYKGIDYHIEPDMSSAAYIYSMCPLLGVPASVKGVGDSSIQSDYEFINALYQTGCEVDTSDGKLTLYPPVDGEIKGVVIDMDDCPDQAMTMAVIACFGNRPTMITGLSSLKYKESDRLNAIVTELTKRGIKTEHTDDSISIYPGIPTAGVVDTYEDHRMAMAFSLMGLRSEGIVIDNPECVNKTFPSYFEALDSLCDFIENI